MHIKRCKEHLHHFHSQFQNPNFQGQLGPHLVNSLLWIYYPYIHRLRNTHINHSLSKLVDILLLDHIEIHLVSIVCLSFRFSSPFLLKLRDLYYINLILLLLKFQSCTLSSIFLSWHWGSSGLFNSHIFLSLLIIPFLRLCRLIELFFWK